MDNVQPDFPLVSCDWLENNRKLDSVAILDTGFFLPNQGRNAEQEFTDTHIPGAQFFDIDLIADQNSTLPHMIPSARDFELAVGRLGIDNHTKVIVYDNNAFMASARVWWTFRVFGHDNVFVLNGGLGRWTAELRPVESLLPAKATKEFQSNFNPGLVCNLQRMSAIVDSGTHGVIDARSPGRFSGAEPELRPGLRSGHIPGSANLHYATLVDQQSGKLESPERLEQLYKSVLTNLKQPIVTTCGSGVTASILALGLFCLNIKDVAVYDGSWSEWGGLEEKPVATGF